MEQDNASSQANSDRAIGIEIAASGTALSVYRETATGPRRRHHKFAAPPTPDETLSALLDLIARLIANDAPTGRSTDTLDASFSGLRLGVALWGHLDRDSGVVHELPQNPRWRDFPLASALAARTGASAKLESAVNAAAWGEMACGATTDASTTLFYLHLGREVAATAIRDGRLLIRHSAREEQFGHTTVTGNGPRCQCGGSGHLTPLASAQSLVRHMIGRASDDDASLARLHAISGGRAEALTAPQVVRLAVEGDPIAADILAEALDALALAIANAALLLTPDTIVIGGPLTEAGETLLAPLRTRLAALLGSVMPVPTLRMGTLEPFAALVGAYALALQSQG